MTRPTLSCALLALCLAAALPAQAQNPGSRDDRGRGNASQRDGPSERRADPGRADDRGDRNRGYRRDDRRDNRRDYDRRDRGPGGYGVYRSGRGAGPDHAFHRGDRLPLQYRNRSYVVDDWRGHRLSAPPRGYHWVQTGADYVLVAVATGVILQLLLGN